MYSTCIFQHLNQTNAEIIGNPMALRHCWVVNWPPPWRSWRLNPRRLWVWLTSMRSRRVGQGGGKMGVDTLGGWLSIKGYKDEKLRVESFQICYFLSTAKVIDSKGFSENRWFLRQYHIHDPVLCTERYISGVLGCILHRPSLRSCWGKHWRMAFWHPKWACWSWSPRLGECHGVVVTWWLWGVKDWNCKRWWRR